MNFFPWQCYLVDRAGELGKGRSPEAEIGRKTPGLDCAGAECQSEAKRSTHYAVGRKRGGYIFINDEKVNNRIDESRKKRIEVKTR